MNVKQLIKELKQYPGNLKVGIREFDNSEEEISGFVSSVVLFDKEQIDANHLSRVDKECFDSQPDRCVVISG